MRKPPASAETQGFFGQYKVIGMASFIGVVLIVLLLSLFSVIMSMKDIPHSAVVPLSIVAVVMGCLVSGYFCGKVVRKNGLLYGLACGVVIFLFAFLMELTFMGDGISLLALYKFVIYCASAMIGGILGVNHRRRVR